MAGYWTWYVLIIREKTNEGGNMKKALKRKEGQGMVEYIIIVAIIAVAAIAVFGLFSDRIRTMLSGATVELGGTETTVADGDSADWLKTLKSDGSTP